jgi:hypothetical protein
VVEGRGDDGRLGGSGEHGWGQQMPTKESLLPHGG